MKLIFLLSQLHACAYLSCTGIMLQASLYPPLKERTFRSRKCAPVLPISGSTCRPKTYKNWTKENLYRAYITVQEGELNIRQAADAYDVPKSTLHDRLSGKVPLDKCSGPKRYLSDIEEAELVNFIVESSKIGYAHSKKQLLALVQETLKAKGRDVVVSSEWFESFKRRHPKITLCTAEPLAYARAVANNVEVIDRYFDILEETLLEKNIMDKPCQIFNCDESGVPLAPSPPKVVSC